MHFGNGSAIVNDECFNTCRNVVLASLGGQL